MSEESQLTPEQAEQICRAVEKKADKTCKEAAATAAAQAAQCHAAGQAVKSYTGSQLLSRFADGTCTNYVVGKQQQRCANAQNAADSICDAARSEAAPTAENSDQQTSAADSISPTARYASAGHAQSGYSLA